MKKWIKKPRIILLVVVMAIIAAGYFYFTGSKKPTYEFSVAKRADIVQEVSVTGRVKPAEAVDLAFEKAGKVANIYVKVSDKVIAGQLLVNLDNADIAAQLTQAEAELKTQKAKLDELRAGTREEEIMVQEVKVANTKADLEEAKKNLVDKLQDAYTKSDDAIRNKVDQLFKSPVLPLPQVNCPIVDSQSETDIEWQRLVIDDVLNLWKQSLNKLTVASDLSSYVIDAKNNLNKIKSFVDKAAFLINITTANANVSQTTIDTWRGEAATARTNVNAAVSNLLAADEKLKTAESNFSLANQELVLKRAGATNEEIAAQEAQVEKAEANVLNYQAQLSKTILRSPIKGIVTKQDAKVGEIVSANATVVSVISVAKFEIEANVTEADIAKIEIGNTAKVTLDAYGEEVVFEAKVVEIEPAETIIEGVTTYKTTFQFVDDDERVKSGMTANIDILTDKRENVITIPRRTVATRNGDKIVKILVGENVWEVKVKTGLTGSDGNVEILEGIKEGDKVITSEK
jgi:HlyD family secretion protein